MQLFIPWSCYSYLLRRQPEGHTSQSISCRLTVAAHVHAIYAAIRYLSSVYRTLKQARDLTTSLHGPHPCFFSHLYSFSFLHFLRLHLSSKYYLRVDSGRSRILWGGPSNPFIYSIFLLIQSPSTIFSFPTLPFYISFSFFFFSPPPPKSSQGVGCKQLSMLCPKASWTGLICHTHQYLVGLLPPPLTA